MRVFIRDQLCTDKPLNLKDLSPIMKIYAGIATGWHQTKWYQNQVHKREEREHTLQMQQDERLKDGILVNLYRELTVNQTLGSKDVCSSLVLAIDSKYRDSINRIKDHKDFILYDISFVEEDFDLRSAFPNMPILIRVSKKVI